MIEPVLPERFQHGIELYRDKGVPPGPFLRAVLENDLKRAFMCADHMSVRQLPGIVSWLYNHFPMNAWGSVEAVDHWIKTKGMGEPE